MEERRKPSNSHCIVPGSSASSYMSFLIWDAGRRSFYRVWSGRLGRGRGRKVRGLGDGGGDAAAAGGGDGCSGGGGGPAAFAGRAGVSMKLPPSFSKLFIPVCMSSLLIVCLLKGMFIFIYLLVRLALNPRGYCRARSGGDGLGIFFFFLHQ